MTLDQLENLKSIIMSRWANSDPAYMANLDWSILSGEDFVTCAETVMNANDRFGFPVLPDELYSTCEANRQLAPETAKQAWDKILKAVAGSQNAIDGLVSSKKACRACILFLLETIALIDPDSMLFTAPRFAAIWESIRNG